MSSWSSVFLAGSVDHNDRRLMAALQARLQSSWLAAWTVGALSRRLVSEVDNKDISGRRVEALSFELGYLQNEFDARLDASISSRVEKLWKVFIETSGLADEWRRAGTALEHARGYAGFVNADANYRAQTAFECLLLIFALSQLAPIVMKLPVDSWSDLTNQIVPAGSLISVLMVGVFLIVRRQR